MAKKTTKKNSKKPAKKPTKATKPKTPAISQADLVAAMQAAKDVVINDAEAQFDKAVDAVAKLQSKLTQAKKVLAAAQANRDAVIKQNR